LCMITVAWLSLHARASRETSNTILKAFRFIVATTLGLIQIALGSTSVLATVTNKINIPADIRTVYSHCQLEPEILRVICCPECFMQYPGPTVAPLQCTWRRSPWSRPCRANLYTHRHTRNVLQQVPKCLYTSQSFESWLIFLLSRAQIDDHLRQTFAKLQNPLNTTRMHDIHNSPAWNTFQGFLRSPYHLVFAIYIDWFNPFTNKIAGKVVSCGAIILYCLNLPLSIRFLTENTFILGMTPAPHSPTVWTILHVLQSVQEMIMKFDLPGKTLATHRHPDGAPVAARIIPLLADLQAVRKVAGYLSHAAGPFCSFCKCHKDDIEDLEYHTWEMRSGTEVRAQAEEWQNLVTIKDKESLARKTGVRWTPLHDMPYWDPVRHVLLGFMHNFLEGVLQHQLRVLWGVGRTKAALKAMAEMEKDENLSNTDTSNFPTLEDDDEQGSQHGSASGLTDDLNAMEMDAMETDQDQLEQMEIDDDTPTPPSIPITLSLDDDSDDEADLPTDPNNIFDFTTDELEAIRACIRDVYLPTWVQRPPSNLGEAKHGKLKAHELLVLFSVIFPLVIPQLWWDGDDHKGHLLQSFCHLVSSTNIIAAYSVTNAEADAYMDHYVKYRTSMKELYPAFGSRPNHHFAMHNGALLKFWGPLSLLSEFPGERMNGDLGKINTNRRLYYMELTMLRQTARHGRLQAFLHDKSIESTAVHQLAEILEPDNGDSSSRPTHTMSDVEIANAHTSATALDQRHYNLLLQYLNATGVEYHSVYDAVPHLLGTLLLPPAAHQSRQFKFDSRTYSVKESHEGNSHIQFYIPGGAGDAVETGFVEVIWELPLEGIWQTFLLVRRHKPLSPAQLRKTPYAYEPCSGLQTKVVSAEEGNDIFIIEPRHIICHLTVYKNPPRMYGLTRETLTICWGLNRRRR
ncbi:hypothetical protein B0H34DRAFT_647608, partial [Crassisporium funariophilum]